MIVADVVRRKSNKNGKNMFFQVAGKNARPVILVWEEFYCAIQRHILL